MNLFSSSKKAKNTQSLATIPTEKKELACCPPEKTGSKKHDSHETTKITAKFDCGFPNKLFIRGEGIEGLSWDKGTLMNCTKNDEWSWETDKHFKNGKFKILVNDVQYETGENHTTNSGKSINITPRF
ncbi:MAG: hypothetical protein JSR46_00300 [Verrucomicrobia bacterium]|nr:hypothetical protein [Verrucomicrobiota bacterium]